MGGRGIRLEARLQRFHTLTELRQFVLERVHIGLHRSWGVLPVLRDKGERPGYAQGGPSTVPYSIHFTGSGLLHLGTCIAEGGNQIQGKILVQVRGRAANQDQPTERQNTTFPARYTDCPPVIAYAAWQKPWR